MKIRSKVPMLQMHENLHKIVNENMFSFTFYAMFHSFIGGQLKQQICYSITLLTSYMALNPFKIVAVQNLMVQMLFPQIQQAPGQLFRNVGKSLMFLL